MEPVRSETSPTMNRDTWLGVGSLLVLAALLVFGLMHWMSGLRPIETAQLTQDQTVNAVLIRPETVVRSPADGELTWLVTEGSEIRRGMGIAEIRPPVRREPDWEDQQIRVREELSALKRRLDEIDEELRWQVALDNQPAIENLTRERSAVDERLLSLQTQSQAPDSGPVLLRAPTRGQLVFDGRPPVNDDGDTGWFLLGRRLLQGEISPVRLADHSLVKTGQSVARVRLTDTLYIYVRDAGRRLAWKKGETVVVEIAGVPATFSSTVLETGRSGNWDETILRIHADPVLSDLERVHLVFAGD